MPSIKKYTTDSFSIYKTTAIILGMFSGFAGLTIFGNTSGPLVGYLKLLGIITLVFFVLAWYEKWWGLIIEDQKYLYGLGLTQRNRKIEINTIIKLSLYAAARGGALLAIEYKPQNAIYKKSRVFSIINFNPTTINQLVADITQLNSIITVEKTDHVIKWMDKEQKELDKVPNKPWGALYQAFMYFVSMFLITFLVSGLISIIEKIF